jgi:hypothetical protein
MTATMATTGGLLLVLVVCFGYTIVFYHQAKKGIGNENRFYQ